MQTVYTHILPLQFYSYYIYTKLQFLTFIFTTFSYSENHWYNYLAWRSILNMDNLFKIKKSLSGLCYSLFVFVCFFNIEHQPSSFGKTEFQKAIAIDTWFISSRDQFEKVWIIVNDLKKSRRTNFAKICSKNFWNGLFWILRSSSN